MNLIALKMLVGDRLKYVALIAGVTFAALLITQQASIFTGYTLRTGAWIRDTSGADLWVMDPQVQFSDDIKPMVDTALQRVRGVAGVAWAVPLYKDYFNCRLPDGSSLQTRVIGLDDATLAGGPPEVIEGSLENLRRDKAILVNAADLRPGGPLSMKLRGGASLKVGDRVDLNDHEAVIVGTYRKTEEFFWEPVIYTTYSRALTMAPPKRKQLMYVMVKAAAGVSPATVAANITRETGLAARTNDEFEWLTAAYVLDKTGILINFGITIALGFLIGLLAAGQTFYTFVLDNLRHFGALKAMGASNFTVIKMLLVQVVTVAALGYGLGVGGAAVTGIFFAKGGLAFQMPWQIPALGAVGVLLVCLGAGLLSIIRVLRLEPAVVFKG